MARTTILVAGLALMGLAGPAAMASDEELPTMIVHKQSGFKYVSGGMGEAGRKAMGKVANKYPMQLVFSIEGQETDITGVKVIVRNLKGEKVIEAVSEGPLFFYTPDSGRWTTEVEYQGEAQSRTVDLVGRRYVQLEFKFKSAAPASQ